jgi:hypothetical protein
VHLHTGQIKRQNYEFVINGNFGVRDWCGTRECTTTMQFVWCTPSLCQSMLSAARLRGSQRGVGSITRIRA